MSEVNARAATLTIVVVYTISEVSSMCVVEKDEDLEPIYQCTGKQCKAIIQRLNVKIESSLSDQEIEGMGLCMFKVKRELKPEASNECTCYIFREASTTFSSSGARLMRKDNCCDVTLYDDSFGVTVPVDHQFKGPVRPKVLKIEAKTWKALQRMDLSCLEELVVEQYDAMFAYIMERNSFSTVKKLTTKQPTIANRMFERFNFPNLTTLAFLSRGNNVNVKYTGFCPTLRKMKCPLGKDKTFDVDTEEAVIRDSGGMGRATRVCPSSRKITIEGFNSNTLLVNLTELEGSSLRELCLKSGQFTDKVVLRIGRTSGKNPRSMRDHEE